MEDEPEDEQADDIAIRTKKNDIVGEMDLKAQREDKLRKMMIEDGNQP